jgi:hypothetical protein
LTQRPAGYHERVDWGFIWLMFIMKIPLGALLWIVWWAIHAQPAVDELPSDGQGRRRHGPRLPTGPRSPRRGPHAEPPPAAPARVRRARGRALQPHD